jgi:NDP-sugar pyrophosphorylase family protein
MLLCAGKGTRLGDLSQEKPKPLLPVCDIPILRYGIANLVARGIKEIVINLHHQGDLIRHELGDGKELGAEIKYSEEETILGTGGGLKKALDLLDPYGNDEPFISMNGKLIFDLDVQALLTCHMAGKSSLGTMVVKRAPNAMQWGAVDVRPEGNGLRVHNILGEGTHMFCGVHVTRPSTVRALPEGEACMVRQGYLPWLQDGERVCAFEHQGGYFAEHSTPKRYLQSNIDLLSGAKLSNPPGPLRGVDPSADLDPSVTIIEPVCIGPWARIGANAKVGPNAVVGTRAQVVEGSRLRDCVVWPGSKVSGRITNAIATPNGIVEASGNDEVDE